MSFNPYDLSLPGVRGLRPYEPGKPVSELERELGVRDAVKLASNENPLGPSPFALEAIRANLPELARYPDGNGFALKQALAEKHAVGMDQLTLGNGSNDVLEFVARVFATRDHEIIFSEHAFVVYPISTAIVGARPVCTSARNYGHDLQAMAEAVTERTRIIYIANPNNPTGTWVTGDAIRELLERVPERCLVVIDEAYIEYVAEADYPDCLDYLPEFPNLVVTRTFSKVYGLAGMRVGYAISSPAIADLLNRVRQPFNVNSLALEAARAALHDNEHLRLSIVANDEGMAFYRDAFSARGLDYIAGTGNFITVRFERPGQEVYEALLRLGVIVRPIGGYGLPDHLRISVGTAAENARCVAALDEVLA